MNFSRFSLLFILAIGLSPLFPACAPKKPRALSLNKPRDHLFPYGLYKHDVDLKIAKTATTKEMTLSFNGVVRLKPESLQMVALSHFGTTVFKIGEDLKTGEIKTDIYFDELKKFESKLPGYYAVLRLFLIARLDGKSSALSPSKRSLRWSKLDPQGMPLEAETLGFDRNAIFSFEEYDQNKIPTKITIVDPSFTIAVKVKDYDI